MGLPDIVYVEENVDFPKFEGDPSDYEWKTDDLEGLLAEFKLSDDKLLRKEEERRKKTDEEKEAEAKERGYKSWEEMAHDSGTVVDFKVKNVDWVDHNQHGSFTVYLDNDNTYWEYELRFRDGDFEESMLLKRDQK